MKRLLLVLWLATAAWAEPTIFTYKQELGLSAQQVKDMKQVVSDLLSSSQKQTKRIEQLDLEYVQMLRTDTPLEEAHAKLLEIERARTEWRYNDLKASYRLLEVLTAEQKKKWREIKASKRTGQ